MSDDGASPDTSSAPGIPEGAISRELPIINKRGLHARASAKFVQMVERFEADVWVTKGGETVGGTSIMGLMMLSAGPGTSIVVSAAEGTNCRAIGSFATSRRSISASISGVRAIAMLSAAAARRGSGATSPSRSRASRVRSVCMSAVT